MKPLGMESMKNYKPVLTFYGQKIRSTKIWLVTMIVKKWNEEVWETKTEDDQRASWSSIHLTVGEKTQFSEILSKTWIKTHISLWQGLEHILYTNPLSTQLAYIYPIATIHIQGDENEKMV